MKFVRYINITDQFTYFRALHFFIYIVKNITAFDTLKTLPMAAAFVRILVKIDC